MPDLPRAQGRRLDPLSDPVVESVARPLTAGIVVGRAARVLLDRPRRVIGTAAVVFGSTAFLTAAVEVYLLRPPNPIEVEALAQVLASLTSALGIVFYAGLLDLVLEAHLDGAPDPPLRVALRRLPLRRLLVADLVLVAAFGVGLLLFVIPGFVVFTLFGLVGPTVVAEDLGVRAAFRRSAQLVRPHLVMAFALVTVPFLVEDKLLHGLDLAGFEAPLLGACLISAAIGATVGAVVGLLEVVLADELRDREPHPVDA